MFYLALMIVTTIALAILGFTNPEAVLRMVNNPMGSLGVALIGTLCYGVPVMFWVAGWEQAKEAGTPSDLTSTISNLLNAQQLASLNTVVTEYPVTVMGYKVRRQGDVVFARVGDDLMFSNYGMTLAELMAWLEDVCRQQTGPLTCATVSGPVIPQSNQPSKETTA